ncbi:MAG: HYR domain-containing protein [Myxococcota bacterium]
MRFGIAIIVFAFACGGDDAPPECMSEAPVIECPADIDLGCIDGPTPVRFNPNVSGCGGGRPTVTCTTESGSLVEGSTDVTCTAENDGGVAECSFRVLAIAGATITCGDDVRSECTGPETPLSLPEPTVDDSCGALGELTSDAPDGFVVGDTEVRFTAGTETCSLMVSVEDTTPPALDCPSDIVLVQSSPTQSVPAPTVVATDVCDPAPVVNADPSTLEPGVTEVAYEASDASGQSARCTASIEVRSAFAPRSARLISAQRQDEGTDITLAWDSGGGDDLAGFAIERADAADGPWTQLDTVPLDQRTYTVASVTTERWFRIVALAGESLEEAVSGGATEAVHAFPIDDALYDLRDERVDGIPFATTLYGVVRHPEDLSVGPFPLVLMLHGNHGICRRTLDDPNDQCVASNDHECPDPRFVTTPNAEGLAYLAESIAAQGYVAVSISGNAVNCRMNFIEERAALIRAHLARWTEFATGAAPFADRFSGAVDLDRVALFGHSRGGEAVSVVPGLLERSPVAGANVISVFSLAPTDFESPAPVNVAYAVVLPGCDGDVQFLFGTDIYDRSIRSDDGLPRAQLLFPGANHNFFNTEWRLDDNNGRVCQNARTIGAPAQRAALEGSFGSWLAATVEGAEVEAFMRAEESVPEGIDAWADRSLDWRWSYHAERLRVDEYEGAGTPGTNLLGGDNRYEGFETASQCFDNDCGNRYPHEKGAILLSWDGATSTATWDLEGTDASEWPYVSFRVVSRRSALNSGASEQVFGVRVVDGAGMNRLVSSSDFAFVPHLYPARDPLEIFQTVRVPLDAFGVDPSSLTRFEIEMMGVGSVLITDVALTR